MAASPLPEIKEGDATGRIARLYDDIRAVIGIPIVNLIFRHMATVDGCLDWTWSLLRPLYVSGKIPTAADALTDGVLPDHVTDLSGPIRQAGLTGADVDAIACVLESYGRANPMNAVGLQVVDLVLAGQQQDTDDRLGLLADGDLLRPKGLAGLLPMTDPASAPERVQIALNKLAFQIHGADTGVIPSLYRHFGQWPDFLEALEPALAPALSGGIEDAAQTMLEDSKVHARTLYNELRLPDSDPNTQMKEALNQLIAQFPLNICRMTVLATLLRRGLPS